MQVSCFTVRRGLIFKQLGIPASSRVAADLFTLTHQGSASYQSLDGNGAAAPEPSSLSQESVALLSQQLVAAHTAYRAGQCETSYDSYQQLAEHFTALNQLPNAKLFYTRCLQVADEHSWQEGQAAAHTNLGIQEALASLMP